MFFITLLPGKAWAQSIVESWFVANENGTLKPEYVANENSETMSVVDCSTLHVKGTHTSGPITGYNNGELENGTLQPKLDNSWGEISTKILSKDGSVAPFYYVQGKGLPINIDNVEFEKLEDTEVYRPKWDNALYAPDGSHGLPNNGSYVALTPSVDGELKVRVWIYIANRQTYIAKASDAKALAFGTDVKVSGYIDKTNNDVPSDSPLYGYPMYQDDISTKATTGTNSYIIGPGNKAVWVYLTFKATANETYYIFNPNAPIGFGGYEFTATELSGIHGVETRPLSTDAPIYNLAGQRVSKGIKGIYIQNGKKVVIGK